MRNIYRRSVKCLLALSLLGVGTAAVGLAVGNDAVYWVGLLLAAPLYLFYVLPAILLLVGVMILAAATTITENLGSGRR
jgi:hypothetical protein